MDFTLSLQYKTRLDLNVDNGLDPECMREDINADIIYQCFEDEKDCESPEEQIIGYMKLLYYNYELALNNDLDIASAFTQVNHSEIGEIIFDFENNCVKEEILDEMEPVRSQNFMVLQDFGIYPKFRKKGIGEIALKGLIRQFSGKCGFIILKSLPKQHEASGYIGENKANKTLMKFNLLEKNEKKAQSKLNSFYKKCGFEELKNHPDFFILSMD